jgi:hypothetical protein
MYNKKGTQVLLVLIIVFMMMGFTLNPSGRIINFNSTGENKNQLKSSNDRNFINQNSLIEALGDKNSDNATKISETYEFLKSKLYSFGQKGQNITISNSRLETNDSIIMRVTIQTENETHIETMTFTTKFDKDQYSGPSNEDVDFLLTPDDVEHHSAMTFPTILMGWQWGWWYHYEWEYEIKVKVLWWTVSIFRAYFELSFGATFRFEMPVSLTAEVPDTILPGQSKKINLTLTALDLEDFYEFVIGAGLVIKAGAYVLGVIGFGYSLDFGWFKYQSFKTPLGEPWYPIDPIEIGLIGKIAKIAGYLKPILEFIADNLLDASILIFPGIGSNLLTARVTAYGNGVKINDTKSLLIQWHDSPSTNIINLTTTSETTDIGIALSKFTIHLNEFWLKFDFALVYKWIPKMIPGIPDYTSWEIETWEIATPGDIFSLQSSQAVYIPFSITPREYGVDLLDISPSPQSVEAGGIASYMIQINNTGNTIDTFELSLASGLNSDWVVFFPKYITLNPGEIETVEMLVYTPRHYTTPAGDYQFGIEAKSLGSQDTTDPKSDEITGEVKILPFYNVAVRRISHFETGLITITAQETDTVEFQLQNLGNVEETYWLSVSSDFNADCFISPEKVIIAPGEIKTVRLNITAPFAYSTYYEAILIATSDKDESIQDDGSIIIRVLPTSESIIYFLNKLREDLDYIPDNAWKNPASHLRKAMDNMIKEVIIKMSGGTPELYGEAYDMLLHDIKAKLTGLKTNEDKIPWDGGIFNNPWIIDDEYQQFLANTCNLLLNDIKILIDLST